jgi:hypothetical protein
VQSLPREHRYRFGNDNDQKMSMMTIKRWWSLRGCSWLKCCANILLCSIASAPAGIRGRELPYPIRQTMNQMTDSFWIDL